MKKYKGYSIIVKWFDSDWGFRFFLINSENYIVYKSEAYFYDYNAMKEACHLIDFIGMRGIVPIRLKIDTNNWRRMHGLPMRRRRAL